MMIVCLWLGQVVTSRATFHYVTDGFVMYLEARSLVQSGKLAVPAEFGRALSSSEGTAIPYVKLGRSGDYHSKYGPGMPLFEAPVIALEMLLGRLSGRNWTDRLIILINPSLLAAGAIATAVAARRAGSLLLASLFAGAGLSFGSFAWPYASFDYSEPLQAMLIAIALIFAIGAGNRGSFSWFLTGLTLGVLLLVKPTLAILIPPFVLYAALSSGKGPAVRSLLFLLSPIGFAAAGLLIYNLMRFGAPFDFGYHPKETFSNPWLSGFWGLTLSPTRGLLPFLPLVLLAPVGIYRLGRTKRAELLLLFLLPVIAIVWYSGWWAWQGGLSWGPRFLVPLLPPLLVLIACGIYGRTTLGIAGILLALGIFVNGLGVVVDTKAYWESVKSSLPAEQQGISLSPVELMTIRPEYGQIPGHLWLLRSYLAGCDGVTRLGPNNTQYRDAPWISAGISGPPAEIELDVISPWALRLLPTCQ